MGFDVSDFRPADSAATISSMHEAKPSTPRQSDARIDEEIEQSGLLMMRRVKQNEERVDVFEDLSRASLGFSRRRSASGDHGRSDGPVSRTRRADHHPTSKLSQDPR